MAFQFGAKRPSMASALGLFTQAKEELLSVQEIETAEAGRQQEIAEAATAALKDAQARADAAGKMADKISQFLSV